MNLVIYLFFIVFAYPISLLPYRVLYIISDLFCFILKKVIKYREKVVYQNLTNSFPQKTKSEIKTIAHEFYKNLSDVIIESVKMLTISRKSVRKRFTLLNNELLDQAFADNRNVILVASHYCNWEMGNWGLTLNTPFKVLAIYKPLTNVYLEKLLYKVRCKFGTLMVDMNHILQEIIRHKSEPTVTVMIMDQTPSNPSTSHWIDFLNQDTLVFLGTEKIARKMNYPVVYCDLQRLKRGYYSIEFIPLFDQPQNTQDLEITKKYMSLLEEIIKKKPQNWLWSHKRWKHIKN